MRTDGNRRNQRRGRRAVLLDGAIVTDARLAAGLSRYELARLIGVSPQVIEKLEDGSNQSEMTVAFIHELALILGLNPIELIVRPEPTTPGGDSWSDDAPELGQLLARTDCWLAIDTIATALAWTLPRTLAAIEQLEITTPGCGLRICWAAGRLIRMQPGPGTVDAVDCVAIRDIAESGVTKPEAKLLSDLALHETVRYSATDEATTRRLRALQLVEIVETKSQHGRASLSLSELARFNLCLSTEGDATGTKEQSEIRDVHPDSILSSDPTDGTQPLIR